MFYLIFKSMIRVQGNHKRFKFLSKLYIKIAQLHSELNNIVLVQLDIIRWRPSSLSELTPRIILIIRHKQLSVAYVKLMHC